LSRARWPRVARLARGLRHAFALDGPLGPLTEADRELLARLASFVVKRRMAGPAILFLESLRPLNYVGSQAMVFLRPFIAQALGEKDYGRLAEALERREGIGALLDAIESAANRPEAARK